MTHDPLSRETIDLALGIFGDRLLFAFVGGSRGGGRNRSRSDVDVFVVTDVPDRRLETSFALALRELHEEHGLWFDHYGEIFDLSTLRALLFFTEHVTRRDPTVLISPCYRGNCLLSIYRKGRVVLDFLAAPKTCIIDPKCVLQNFVDRAAGHLDIWPSDHPPGQDCVDLGFSTRLSRLNSQWSSDDASAGRLDTPIGVQLGRWFGDELYSRLEHAMRASLSPLTPHAGLTCPIRATPSDRRSIAHMQCLGIAYQ